VLGGLDSPIGAVVGGLVIGIARSMLDNYVSYDIDAFYVLVLLIVVLMIKPTGLFTRTATRRV
jgi:branched-chain amino acid transport system permease protein